MPYRNLVLGVIGMLFTMFASAQTSLQEGNATWYATPGNLSLRAEHATLPVGTRIRVTNKNNGMEVIVIISGRIPNEQGRILNISQEAARQLEMGEAGSTTPVTIEVLTMGRVPDPPSPVAITSTPEPLPEPEPVSPEPSPSPSPPVPTPPVSYMPPAEVKPSMPDPGSGNVYRVQVGSYLSVQNAQNTFARLQAAGFSPAYERYENYYRVVLSGIRASDLQTTAQLLGNAGIHEVWIRQEN